MPASVAKDEVRLQRFLNEVKIARQISHPGVCRVYDVGEVDGHHFISMEYVDGEDLASLLRRIGQGGFGEVWRAEAPGGVEVAIKIIVRPIDQDEGKRELDSIELIKRLRHPFLLQTQAFWALEDRLLIVMDLASGQKETVAAVGDEPAFVWAPDGRQLAIAANRGESGLYDDVALMDTRSGAIQPLGVSVLAFFWTPDSAAGPPAS